MSAVTTLRRLARGARRVPLSRWPGLVRTAGLVVAIEIGVRTARLPRVSGWAGVPLADAPPTPASSATPATDRPAPLELSVRERVGVEDARRVLSVPGVDGTCLRQSLLVGHVLRRRAPRLVLGVAKRGGAVAAHAWIEVEGWTIDDFHVLARPPVGFERLPAGVS
ncbi:lasso peptide biosynthesis B2 protein [Cellulosimicrobium arenosum]|uniref:Lasso peptide biosynthesis B2 protein n=1 Tax=Cellulosimicrobium arenosum TaxID=2708133 RepID=A0A927G9T3_9MICO|nr:lasso peptide biosynthesis B2 protein [Cellulosimicrobium arenosum]MBD8078930.1 lasso peptide biosynthesis B2 protein [Cellulosimicrobium arenosum]